MKSFFKELFIVILLCAAIILIMLVLFYDYNPVNKIVPQAVQYKTPDNITEMLSEYNNEKNSNGVGDQASNIVFSIEAQDLDNYKKDRSYKAGKPDPFSEYATGDTSSNTSGGTSGGTTIGGGTTGTNGIASDNTVAGTSGSSSNTSSGTFFNDTGSK